MPHQWQSWCCFQADVLVADWQENCKYRWRKKTTVEKLTSLTKLRVIIYRAIQSNDLKTATRSRQNHSNSWGRSFSKAALSLDNEVTDDLIAHIDSVVSSITV